MEALAETGDVDKAELYADEKVLAEAIISLTMLLYDAMPR